MCVLLHVPLNGMSHVSYCACAVVSVYYRKLAAKKINIIIIIDFYSRSAQNLIINKQDDSGRKKHKMAVIKIQG